MGSGSSSSTLRLMMRLTPTWSSQRGTSVAMSGFLPLSHGLTNRAKLLRRIQRLRADLQRVRGRGAAILLLHNISPWIIIFPKDRVSREQTQIVSDGARGES